MTSAPYNRKTIEDALFDWIQSSTELAATAVIWADQKVPQPTYPYASLKVNGPFAIGQDEEYINGEPDDPEEGAEVAIEVRGLRQIVVSCNTYALSNDPEANAHALMDRARASLGLPTPLAALRAAGLALVKDGEVQNLDALEDDAFISRAQMDITFGLASNVEERIGFIATAEVVADANLGAPFTLALESE